MYIVIGASAIVAASRSAGSGFPAGGLDWEEYLGALEEINYRGFLTIWPDPCATPGRRSRLSPIGSGISEGRSDRAGGCLITPRDHG